MRDYTITTDTTCDLPEAYLEEHHIDVVPLYYYLEDVLYGDEVTLAPEVFYDKMRQGSMPTTMAANPESLERTFRKHLDAGRDILHVAFSSGLSSSYSTAGMVAMQLKEEYPDAKILVIDTLAASLGEGLLVHKAVMNKDRGMDLEANAQWLEDNKLHLCHQFTVDDLNHLYRGGRVSKATAVMGTLINIKPVLHVDNEGHLIATGKTRGRKKSLKNLVDNMEALMGSYKDQNDVVFISHGDALEDAQSVADMVKERFGIENIMINLVSPTIGAHSGPGTIALFFMAEKR